MNQETGGTSCNHKPTIAVITCTKATQHKSIMNGDDVHCALLQPAAPFTTNRF